MSGLAVTWWGHASATVEVGGVRLAIDPLLSSRLFHLTRSSDPPAADAAVADLVLVSHLHHDHLHLPSLRMFDTGVPMIVPRGALLAVPGLRTLNVVEASPGETVALSGVVVEVLAAHHDGRRHNFSRHAAPALGFRVTAGDRSFWYSGDTGWHDGLARVPSVDLAVVPIGGWGPTLGPGHLDPEQAARAVALVGAVWSLPVHYGTYWPVAMRAIDPGGYRRLFQGPAESFAAALQRSQTTTVSLTPPFGERIDLSTRPRGRG